MTDSKSTDITWHPGIDAETRQAQLGRRGVTVWFTGLSGSGKSTVADSVEKALVSKGVSAYRLDGDNVRHGLNRDLGFSAEDRVENIRRIAEVARLMTDACLVTLVSFISPYRADRDTARQLHLDSGLAFLEVFVDCPLEEAERRDPKGLYRKARSGQISDMTGIDAPYEAPEHPELVIRTAEQSVADGTAAVLALLADKGVVAS
jgi:adenylylsulfate kinase